MILTLAYDAAVRRYQGTLHTCAVPFESFLQELFGDTNHERIANSKPDDGHDTFRNAFKNAYIRFTHLVRAGDESAVSTQAAYAVILRSMASQCSHKQEKIDIMVPVALRNEALKEEIMTGVSIDVDASKLSFFPEDQELFGDTRLRPYISLIVELGIVPTEKHHAAGSEVLNRQRKSPGSLRWNQCHWMLENQDVHPLLAASRNWQIRATAYMRTAARHPFTKWLLVRTSLLRCFHHPHGWRSILAKTMHFWKLRNNRNCSSLVAPNSMAG